MKESMTVICSFPIGWQVTFYADNVAIAVHPDHPPRMYPIDGLRAFAEWTELPGLRLAPRDE